jgi:hypothetical protein
MAFELILDLVPFSRGETLRALVMGHLLARDVSI